MNLENMMFNEGSQTQKDHIFYDSVSMRYPETNIERMHISGFQRIGARETRNESPPPQDLN